MNVVEARNLHKTYRRGGVFGRHSVARAVAGVDLALAPGRCLALVGSSGSGKSTLARLLLGLERPDRGEVRYGGTDFAALRGAERRRARRRVQAVFQNSPGAVNPRFTALDIVAEPLVNFDGLRGAELEARVEALLVEVGLTGADLKKRPHQFSGGELQRICLARALAPGPDLVVLDEALSALDLPNQVRMLDVLARVRAERGAGFLFITHDLRLVADCADAMAVMDAGRIVLALDDLNGLDGLDEGAGVRCHALDELLAAVLPAGGAGDAP